MKSSYGIRGTSVQRTARGLLKAFAGTGVLVVAASLGCSAEVGEESAIAVGTTQDELYWRSAAVWDKRDVSVCWTFSGFAAEKALVKAALKGQRSWAAAGNINFVGWGSCGTADIRINNGNNRSEVGKQSSGATDMWLDFRSAPEDFYLVCLAHGLDRNECITTNAVHEFGHAVSYLHEQNRDDVSVPGSCEDQTDDGLEGDSTFGGFDTDSVVGYCNFSTEVSSMDRRGTERIYGPRFGDSPTLGDYNADGRQDLFCRDVISGSEYVDYASTSGQFDGSDWSAALGWCNTGDHRRMFQGDFNGDGRTDLLCFGMNSGDQFIDYANSSGQFGGTDWSAGLAWCNESESRRLYVGDFNGDGRDDLLCHDRVNGGEWIDYASTSGQFGGTNWSSAAGWCNSGSSRRLHVGDFNGDGRDDILCHDLVNGSEWIDYASTSGQFAGTDWNASLAWCNFDGAAVFVGDFNGDGLSDLVCHSGESGNRWIDFATTSTQFGGTDWSAGNGYCSSWGSRLFVGDVNGDNRDDLVCHRIATGTSVNGTTYVDYANSSGQLAGTDWSLASWCAGSDSRELM
jgi:hypothetical protein